MSAKHGPNSGDPNLLTLGVDQQLRKKLKEILEVFLEALDNVFKNGKEDIRANFSMSDGSGCAGSMKEW